MPVQPDDQPMTQPDLFQPERSEPYDFTVSFGDRSELFRAMEREGIPPRLMDVLRGQYRLRGSARPSVLARVLKETGARPEHVQPKATQRRAA
jgi:hypothetical protein